MCLVSTFLVSHGQIKEIRMNNVSNKYGIEGKKAPELEIPVWIDVNGNELNPIKISDFKGKFVVLYCFQAWCPGCHNHGLPSLQEMVKELDGKDDIVFLAIQTVFEGRHANTFARVIEIQKEYDLKIPFGHDIGNDNSGNISSTMKNYRTGGTPWFVFIDKEGKVIFNDFHLNTEKAIEYLKGV